jgi:hypothetical protein
MAKLSVPQPVLDLLIGSPVLGSSEQAFPVVTVDDRGFPHVALLSRSELDVPPSASAVLAVVGSQRTRANLVRDGRATLIAVGATSAYYLKLQLVGSLEDEGVMGCVLSPVEFKEDSLGIPLIAMGFEATADIARMERWEVSARILRRLADELIES